MPQSRREFLSANAFGLLASAANGVLAQAAAPGLQPDEALAPGSAEFIPLWSGVPPGAASARLDLGTPHKIIQRPQLAPVVTSIARPGLSVYPAARPDGSAMVLISGGGYAYITAGLEVARVAQWLAARGTTVFVLLHRLAQDGWSDGPDTPLQDAQRAMRLVRANAARWRIAPTRVGVMGASAGGHVAGQLMTRHDAPVYAAIDTADTASARPDLACLNYPVVTMQGAAAHAGSRQRLLGPAPTAGQAAQYSNELLVRADMPPAFLLHAADDPSVPVENTLMLFAAMRRVKADTALHIFETGGHGFGLDSATGPTVRAWPELFLAWAASHRMFG